MRAGPKAAVDDSVLPFRPRSTGSARFAKFCEKFVKVPKGTGARSPLRLGRAWEQVGKLMVAVRDGVDPAGVDVRVQWAAAATRSVAQEADAITKLFAAGLLPASHALKKLGYADDEITEIRAARRAEALDNVGVNLRALPTATAEPAA